MNNTVYGRLIVVVAGILLLAALVVGTWEHYRLRQRLHLREKEALEAVQENLRLKATLEMQAGEQQRISQEIRDDIVAGLTTEQLVRKMNEIVWTFNHEQDSLGSLVGYIRSNSAEMLGQAGIEVHFEIDEDIPEIALPPEFRRNVYLAAKEAVHNIIRHSGAGAAEIGVHVDGKELTVVVQDNGKGIYKAGGNHLGNGMKNMQRRVEQVGGRMEITTGGGMAITIVAPLPEARLTEARLPES
jgi:two-component system NarL family sensor kinase